MELGKSGLINKQNGGNWADWGLGDCGATHRGDTFLKGVTSAFSSPFFALCAIYDIFSNRLDIAPEYPAAYKIAFSENGT